MALECSATLPHCFSGGGWSLMLVPEASHTCRIQVNPTDRCHLPVQYAAHRELSRLALNEVCTDCPFAFNISATEFAHPALRVGGFFSVIGPLFIFGALVFGFVIQVSLVVQERELRLRQAMRTMGLSSTPFWLTWYARVITYRGWP